MTRDFVVNDTVRATGIGTRVATLWFAYGRINQISTNVVNNFSRKLCRPDGRATVSGPRPSERTAARLVDVAGKELVPHGLGHVQEVTAHGGVRVVRTTADDRIHDRLVLVRRRR